MPEPTNWRTAIHELAAFERASASEGERRGAEMIAGWLRDHGCRAEIEPEQAVGGYWGPVGLANVLAGAAALLALRRSRRGAGRMAAALTGALTAAALWDDLGHGRRWFRRALFPRRTTWNVVAEAGDPGAERVVALVAHHDAAHSGLVFHPALGRIGPRLFPRQLERAHQTLPILYAVWLGPVLVAAGGLTGARRLLQAGAALSSGAAVAMADVARSEVVPGANDNLSAVGVLMGVAEALRREPPEGVRVLLVSTGSEESFSEGMQAFGRRHFPNLDPERTEFVCLECLGGPRLLVLEGEGMLKMRYYPPAMCDAVDEAARAAGVTVTRGLRTVAATDAIIPLRAGYPVATLASMDDDTKLPLNYHWPNDVPEELYWETIEQAIATCESFVRMRGSGDGAAT